MTWGCFYYPRAEAAPAPAKIPVPLLGVHAHGTICDFTAEVTLNQRYKNLEQNPIEIEYIFPLDDLGAVCRFEVEIDGKRIVGKIMDKDRALDTYDDAIASGSGAYLLKQNTTETASCMIGNLPPQKECIVKITYVTELTPEDEKVRFVLPTTIAPLHKWASNQGPAMPRENEPNGLTIDFKLTMASSIKSISSPTHPLDLELDGTNARVKLGTNSTALDQDLAIMIGVADPFTPRLWVESSGVEYYSMAIFYPTLVPAYPQAEFIFVVDQSGSMAGTQMEDAKGALQILIRSIPEGSKFNIVGFGSSFQVMAPQSVMYNQASFATANQLINNMGANLGGTDLKKPLEWLFRQQADFNYPRQVFVLTDGQLDDTNVVLEMVKRCSGYELHPKVKASYQAGRCTYSSTSNVFAPQHWYQCRTCNMVDSLGLCGVCKTTCHAGHDVIGPYFSDFFCDCAEATYPRTCYALHQAHPLPKELYKTSTRVFSLGIGAGVDRILVTGLAKVGGGTAVFVKTGEKMERKIVGQLKLSLQPSLSEVSIDWSAAVQQSPQVPPPIFSRNRLIVYGKSTSKPEKVILRAFADCKVPVSAELQLRQAPENGIVRKLAAKARIRDLEELNAAAQKHAIVAVSIKNQVLSTFTAFVAVEQRRDGTEGTMQSRRVVAAPPVQQVFSSGMPTLCSLSSSPTATFGYASPASASMVHPASASSFGSFGDPSLFQPSNRASLANIAYSAAPSPARHNTQRDSLVDLLCDLSSSPPARTSSANSPYLLSNAAPAAPSPARYSAQTDSLDDLLCNLSPAPSASPAGFYAQQLSSQPHQHQNSQSQQRYQQQQQQQQLQQQYSFQNFSASERDTRPGPRAAPVGGSMGTMGAMNPGKMSAAGTGGDYRRFPAATGPTASQGSYNASSDAFGGLMSYTPTPAPAPAVHRTPDQKLAAIMQLQAFNGSWNLDQSFATAVNILLQTLVSLKPSSISDSAWATAVGLAYLELKLGGLKEAWEMAAQKSVTFLKGSSGLLATAKQVIQTHSK